MKQHLLSLLLFLKITFVFSQNINLESYSNVFLKDSTHFGIAIGIYNNGEITNHYKGSKYNKFVEDVNEETLFEIGSVTKIFTTYILSSLETDKELYRNQKLIDFLPNTFKNKKTLAPITLKHLATHASGIPITAWDDWDKLQKEETFNENNPFDLLTKSFIMDKLKTVDSLSKFEEYHYSNFSFGLLSLVLSSKTGLSYGELLEKHVKNPLQIENLFVNVPQSKTHTIALPHKKTEIVPLIDLSDSEATGGIKSTSKELITFLAALADPKSEKQKEIQQIVFSKQFDNEAMNSVALGWGIFEIENEPVFWKNGGTYGSGSIVIVCPSKKLAVSILANSDSTGVIQNYAVEILSKLIKNK